MDIGAMTAQKNSAVELGHLLKNIAAEKQGMSDKLIGMNVEQQVSNEKLGNTADYLA